MEFTALFGVFLNSIVLYIEVQIHFASNSVGFVTHMQKSLAAVDIVGQRSEG